MSAASFRKTNEEFPVQSQIADPGAVLRKHRIERKLTLSDVSKLTGLPVSTLSKVETGKMALNYGKLLRLSQGLDLDITRLFSSSDSGTTSIVPAPFVPATAGAANGRRSLSRAMEGPSISTVNYNYIYPAADLLRKSLNPMILDVRARSIEEFDDLMRHPGEEYAMVLEGQCEFYCDLYAPAVMNKGDSIYFDGVMGHAYVAIGDGPCRILSVCSASDEDLKSVLQPL
jgi:transcriptional regulator with XRE-family HTH domain